MVGGSSYCNGSTTQLLRTTSLPSRSAFTACVWFNRVNNIATYDTVLCLSQGASQSLILQINDSVGSPLSHKLITWHDGESAQIVSFNDGDWVFCAITADGTNFRGYGSRGLETIGSVNTPENTFTPDGLYLGNDGFVEGGNWYLAAWKVWDRVLSLGELYDERQYYVPIHTKNLHLWVPLVSATGSDGSEHIRDLSGNGRNPTPTGTFTTILNAPPIPWAPKIISHFDFTVAGGITVATGTATETDTALGLGKVKIRAVGVASETDTAIAPAVAELRAVGVSEETDTALALSRTKARAAGVATETDAALGLGRVKITAAGMAEETDTGLALTPAKAIATGVASETDTALDLGRVKITATGLTTETDTALDLGRLKTKAVATSTETDTALDLTRSKARTTGVASETDASLDLGRVKLLSPGIADETDTALALSLGLTVPVGTAVETDTALELPRVKIWSMGQATETDTALALALAAGGQKPVAYGMVIV